MRTHLIALALALCVTTFYSHAAAQQRVYTSLERIGEAAARLESVYCATNVSQTLQGGIDGINAMPDRSAEAPLAMNESGLADFAAIYGDLIASADDPDAIEHAAINGMIHAFDPSGSWMPPEEARRPRGGGILIELGGADETPLVLRVFDDGPAHQAGILAGDKLIEVDGQPTTGLRRHEVVARLQGEIGSPISVVVERDGAPITFSMLRTRNTRDSVSWRMQGTIGIITIETFNETTARAVRDAIRDIRREERNPAGYIIDLRNNGGGLLDQVIETADYFIDGGAVVIIRPFSDDCGPEDAPTFNARRRDETDGAPLIVLTNENTASGAETVAAALRERRGARLVGETTFGNALIHTVIPMNGYRDGYLRLTTGVMASPEGVSWDDSGLVPDLAVEPRSVDTDGPLDAAIDLLGGAT